MIIHAFARGFASSENLTEVMDDIVNDLKYDAEKY